ncbi:sulfate transporter [Klebsiella pneumoniae]|uniref:Sulfate transporter n=1 Tax=Klebsiella pneumoniae TaxID=573 RepID=A0A2X3CQ64_KLEPN|nr:sulfate transporter [Klebsiella pneumoniae]
MSGQLSWTREGETLALHGELDQDLLVPLWEARAQATAERRSSISVRPRAWTPRAWRC